MCTHRYQRKKDGETVSTKYIYIFAKTRKKKNARTQYIDTYDIKIRKGKLKIVVFRIRIIYNENGMKFEEWMSLLMIIFFSLHSFFGTSTHAHTHTTKENEGTKSGRVCIFFVNF